MTMMMNALRRLADCVFVCGHGHRTHTTTPYDMHAHVPDTNVHVCTNVHNYSVTDIEYTVTHIDILFSLLL